MPKKLFRLRWERIKTGLTQIELSLQTGVPQSLISCAERGLDVLNERNKAALADFFQIDIAALLKEVSL